MWSGDGSLFQRVSLFRSSGLLDEGQGLQNESAIVEELTSHGYRPYFPKLDSSFCGDETHDDSGDQDPSPVSELLLPSVDWKTVSGWDTNQVGRDTYPANNDLILESTSVSAAT
jgi:hypothetical protein